MEEFIDADLRGARFATSRLTRATFDQVDLTGATFRGVDLSDVIIRGADLSRVRISGAELAHVEINAELLDVVVNGVDIAPLVEAELDRRDPDRPRMRPTTVEGFREAWDLVETRWDATVAHARRLDPALLHESVNGEWSFIETLRHLVFATDAWVRRALLGDPAPYHPLGLPWDEAPDDQGLPRDRAARPTLDEVLELRRDRMAGVRAFLAELTPAQLAGETTSVEGPGWPPPVSFPVSEPLLVVLNEEYLHRLFAERDLTLLEARTA